MFLSRFLNFRIKITHLKSNGGLSPSPFDSNEEPLVLQPFIQLLVRFQSTFISIDQEWPLHQNFESNLQFSVPFSIASALPSKSFHSTSSFQASSALPIGARPGLSPPYFTYIDPEDRSVPCSVPFSFDILRQLICQDNNFL